MADDDLPERIAEAIGAAIMLARVGERITAAVATLIPAAQALTDLTDLDDELVPEVDAAANHLRETAAALSRLAAFVQTRFEIKIEALAIDPTPDEGGPHA